ncbi:PLDc N-terminal domain-containing protein [Seonamhaeicola sp. NFXS20]|uniref:PLDc N-terminal domain-containing protein n=1 Tax=Seonamhaeicola sp. NFXS20 TaxID=2816959 RepID=UPI003B8D9540
MQNILFQIFIGISIALWIWTLMDFYESKFKNSKFKVVCFLMILLLPLIGSIFYFQLKKNDNISFKKEVGHNSKKGNHSFSKK